MQAAEDGAPVVLAEIAMRRALDVDGDPKPYRVVTLDVERRTKLVNSREKDLVEEDRQRALAHADAQRKANEIPCSSDAARGIVDLAATAEVTSRRRRGRHCN
jgi:hypothetical protein